MTTNRRKENTVNRYRLEVKGKHKGAFKDRPSDQLIWCRLNRVHYRLFLDDVLIDELS